MRLTIFQRGLHAHNLLEVFETYQAEILRFAECSIGSSKIKRKVSDTYAVPNLPQLAAVLIARRNKAQTPLPKARQKTH